MTDRLDTMLRDYVRFSDRDLFDDDEAVDAFIGTDHLLDAVDRAADLRPTWGREPVPYCWHGSAHERHGWHYPHAVYINGVHDHAEGDRDHGHDHEMPF